MPPPCLSHRSQFVSHGNPPTWSPGLLVAAEQGGPPPRPPRSLGLRGVAAGRTSRWRRCVRRNGNLGNGLTMERRVNWMSEDVASTDRN